MTVTIHAPLCAHMCAHQYCLTLQPETLAWRFVGAHIYVHICRRETSGGRYCRLLPDSEDKKLGHLVFLLLAQRHCWWYAPRCSDSRLWHLVPTCATNSLGCTPQSRVLCFSSQVRSLENARHHCVLCCFTGLKRPTLQPKLKSSPAAPQTCIAHCS